MAEHAFTPTRIDLTDSAPAPSRLSIIPAGAIFDIRLDRSDLRVLGALGIGASIGQWAQRSQVGVARTLGVARSTLQRSLRRLEGYGWIEIEVGNPTTGNSPHRYRIVESAPEKDAPIDGVFHRERAT